MEALKCPNCGGNIIKADDDIYFCPYCGIGIPTGVKKTKLNIEIKSDETKKIIVEKRNKAEELKQKSKLLDTWFMIGIFVVFLFICLVLPHFLK